MRRDGDKCLLILPMVHQGQSIGLIEVLDHQRERKFSRQEMRLANAVASQAAVALHNATVFAQLTRSDKDAVALRHAIETISTGYATLHDQTTTSGVLQAAAEVSARALGAHLLRRQLRRRERRGLRDCDPATSRRVDRRRPRHRVVGPVRRRRSRPDAHHRPAMPATARPSSSASSPPWRPAPSAARLPEGQPPGPAGRRAGPRALLSSAHARALAPGSSSSTPRPPVSIPTATASSTSAPSAWTRISPSTDRFTTLVDPGMPIPLFVARLTGISDADVAGAPGIAEALAGLREFAGDATLVGHNAGFDREHLAAAARRGRTPPLQGDWFDTLEAALLLYPELDRHALPVLVEELGLSWPAHRALPDAEATAAVLAHLARRAAGLGDVERRLLESVSWAPLRRARRAARCGPTRPRRRWSPTSRRRARAPLAVLPVKPGAWRRSWTGPTTAIPPGPARARPASPAASQDSAAAPARCSYAEAAAAHLRPRRHRRLRGRDRHGQEPRLPAAGGVRRRRRRPPHRREHQDQGAAAAAGAHGAAARRRRAAAGMALGAPHGARELPLPATPRRGGRGGGRDAARPRPHAGARLPRGARAARRRGPLGATVPGDPGAPRTRRPGARAALLARHLPRPLLPRAPRLPLAPGAQPARRRLTSSA